MRRIERGRGSSSPDIGFPCRAKIKVGESRSTKKPTVTTYVAASCMSNCVHWGHGNWRIPFKVGKEQPPPQIPARAKLPGGFTVSEAYPLLKEPANATSVRTPDY